MTRAATFVVACNGNPQAAPGPTALGKIADFEDFKKFLGGSSDEGWQALGNEESFNLAMQGVAAAGYKPTDFHDLVRDIVELGVPDFLKAMPLTVGPRVLAKFKQLLVCICECTTIAPALGPAPINSTGVQLATAIPNGPPDTFATVSSPSRTVRDCGISLLRGDGDYSTMMRCAIRGQLQHDQGGKRRKVLTAVLDNSGSMRNAWPLVVDAITRVFTDDLLQDPLVSLNAIAYNTHASEVTLPARSADLSTLLRGQFAPGGITNFEAAFELAQQMIQRDIDRLADVGVHASSIDVTTLLFTDGEDTSVPPHGCKSEAATAKARAAGDKFRVFLSQTGCAAHTCIAAFGQQHNPEQCQYLSDRYFYINRQEVLSEWLSGGLSELLESAGHCSLQLKLPHGVTLAEPIPSSIGLDAEGRVDYEAWLLCNAMDRDNAATIEVTVDDSGSIALQGSTLVSSATLVDPQNLDGRLFVLDAAEMQLRQIARELRGRRPSKVECALLRERLVGVKVLAQPVSDAASNIKLQLCGRALLLARLEELETRRNRLSYALGHFDEGDQDTRHIGAVGIDAILRDASQRISLNAQTLALSRGAEAAAALPEPEELSAYAQKYTNLAFSECDARTVASVGDACFFLSNGLARNGPLISYDAFSMLSRGGAIPIQLEGESFTCVGIPLYCSKGHFDRAMLIMPNILRALSGENTYKAGVSEKCLLTLLGRAVAAHLELSQRSPDLSLFHQARSVAAVFEVTMTPSGKTMLDEVLSEAATFITNKACRRSAKLYDMIAIGLLAQQWPSSRVAQLVEAILEEATQRAVVPRLQQLSESEKLRLAWALLGPPKEEGWLDEPMTITSSCPEIQGFNILTSSVELENLHQIFPTACAPRDTKLLPWLFSTTSRTDLVISQWSSMRTLLSRWSSAAEEFSSRGLWQVLDEIMISDNVEFMDKLTAVLRSQEDYSCAKLNQALANPIESIKAITEECLRGVRRPKDLEDDASSRMILAAVLRSVVAERTAIAQKYSIKCADYPSASGRSHPISKQRMQQMWGACAEPVDQHLYGQARHDTHQRYNMLPLVVKEALSDKEYRKRGGRFVFPTHVDTFIPGLHRRTKDLHSHWKQQCKSAGAQACDAAVQELLLRLPWDDEDARARRKLVKILTNIWRGLENPSDTGDAVSSALWLEDDKEENATLNHAESPTSNSSVDDADWKCV